MALREQLRILSRWTGTVGILFISIGGLVAVRTIFMHFFGAIPAIIVIVLGVKLYSAKMHADKILTANTGENQEAELVEILTNLNMYFKIVGIIGLILVLLNVTRLVRGSLLFLF